MADRVGEVIESDSTAFQAQCYRLHEPPALGSLVLVPDGDVEVVGVVSEAGTSSIQPGRKPLARGEDETSVEALYANNPQIEKLLMTLFTAQIVGYRNGGEAGESMMQRLPSRPPRVHTFVYDCPTEVRSGFRRVDGILEHSGRGAWTGRRPTDQRLPAADECGVRG